MLYKVMKQYGRGTETLAESFKTLEEAKSYANQAAASDAAMKINAVYRVYEFDDMLFEVDSNKVTASAASQSSSVEQAAQGASSSSANRPTPLNTAPRPPGTPQTWSKDDDKKDDEK